MAWCLWPPWFPCPPSRITSGYTTCNKPSSETETPCDQLPPEEVARQRAKTDARYAAAKRRYDEQQQALPVPTTKADLTLLCHSFYDHTTVQVWFGAALLSWGTGEHREIWRLDRVSPAEITFKRLLADWPHYDPLYPGKPTLFDADGHIDRVTGSYSRWIDPAHTEPGHCEPAAPKF